MNEGENRTVGVYDEHNVSPTHFTISTAAILQQYEVTFRHKCRVTHTTFQIEMSIRWIKLYLYLTRIDEKLKCKHCTCISLEYIKKNSAKFKFQLLMIETKKPKSESYILNL